MALLPQKVGPLTLVRALGNDGVCQSYVGILDGSTGKQVIVRKLLPALARSPEVRADVQSRLGDLEPIQHAGLLPLTHTFEHDGDLYLAHDWPDAVTLADVVAHCAAQDEPMPLNLFLHLAVQICNALEGLHGQVGEVTGAPHVLHLDIRPSSIYVTQSGEVSLGVYGLVPGPTFATQTGGFRLKTAYLSPEQTHGSATSTLSEDDSEASIRRLSPASDLFSLGAVLYELLVHKPMFSDSSPLRTMAKVRRAEVTTQLLEVKEVFPGVDRVLYRALSKNPRHRYQRAFVLREDLRGLMVQFSFSNIQSEARQFLGPLFASGRTAVDDLLPERPKPRPVSEPTDMEPTVLGTIDVDAIRREIAEQRAKEAFAEDFDAPADYGGKELAPTGAFDAPSRLPPLERPVQYAAESPDAAWTDVHARAKELPASPLEALRAIPEGPDDVTQTEDDLAPVDFTAEEIDLEQPLSDQPDPHAETQLLAYTSPALPQRVSAPLDDANTTRLLVGAGMASLAAAMLTLCAGGAVLGALATRSPEPPQVVAPTRGRPTLPSGPRAWRRVPEQPLTAPPVWVPLDVDVPQPGTLEVDAEDRSSVQVELAVRAMDDGDFRQALKWLEGIDVRGFPEDDRFRAVAMVHEIRGAAHRALYERSQPPDPHDLDAARASWSSYRAHVDGHEPHVQHAERHLTHLEKLRL